MLHRWELPVPSRRTRSVTRSKARPRSVAGRRPGRAALRLKSDAPVRRISGKIPSSVRRATRLAARHVSPSGHWRASSRCGHASRKPRHEPHLQLVRHRVSGRGSSYPKSRAGVVQEAASGAPCGRCAARRAVGPRLLRRRACVAGRFRVVEREPGPGAVDHAGRGVGQVSVPAFQDVATWDYGSAALEVGRVAGLRLAGHQERRAGQEQWRAAWNGGGLSGRVDLDKAEWRAGNGPLVVERPGVAWWYSSTAPN